MIRPTIPLNQRQIVVDVDTQEHFFLDNGPICVRGHLNVLDNIRRVMAWVRMRRIHMVSTVQMFPGNVIHHNSNITCGLGLKKINCTLHNKHISFDATDYTDLPGRILRQYNQVILYKRYFDPFEEPRAERILTESEADEFILIGAPAEGAVRATALGLLHRQKKVTVLTNATGSLNVASGRIALRHMKARGAILTNTNVFLSHSSRHLARACR
ncbi:MAG: cysteine hydrolase [Planctomycetes bacterium]|nr:cysteine hydrolase [Planctomycetota bacterium]